MPAEIQRHSRESPPPPPPGSPLEPPPGGAPLELEPPPGGVPLELAPLDPLELDDVLAGQFPVEDEAVHFAFACSSVYG
jgi:hypothetical protein